MLSYVQLTCAQEFHQLNETNGLKVGDTISDFSAITHDSSRFVLSGALKTGPVVVVFYRGQWCPICSKHLKRFQDSLELLTKAGATVIAISPEKPDYALKTVEKNNITFPVLYDSSYAISNMFDVAYMPRQIEITRYNFLKGAQLSKANSDGFDALPVPATFVINKQRIVVCRQFNSDYRIRSSVSEILKCLP